MSISHDHSCIEGIEFVRCPSLSPYGASCTSIAYFLSPSCANGHRLYDRMRCVCVCVLWSIQFIEQMKIKRNRDWYTHLLPPYALRSIQNVSIACVLLLSIDRSFRNYKQSCQRRTIDGSKRRRVGQATWSINNPSDDRMCSGMFHLSLQSYLLSLLMESKSFRSRNARQWGLRKRVHPVHVKSYVQSDRCIEQCSEASAHCNQRMCAAWWDAFWHSGVVVDALGERWIECKPSAEEEMTRHLFRLAPQSCLG